MKHFACILPKCGSVILVFIYLCYQLKCYKDIKPLPNLYTQRILEPKFVKPRKTSKNKPLNMGPLTLKHSFKLCLTQYTVNLDSFMNKHKKN